MLDFHWPWKRTNHNENQDNLLSNFNFESELERYLMPKVIISSCYEASVTFEDSRKDY